LHTAHGRKKGGSLKRSDGETQPVGLGERIERGEGQNYLRAQARREEELEKKERKEGQRNWGRGEQTVWRWDHTGIPSYLLNCKGKDCGRKKERKRKTEKGGGTIRR